METIRVYKKKATAVARKPRFAAPPVKRTKGPTEKWCRPRLIYGLKGNAIITTSKWYKNSHTCIFDWLQRDFLVIEDESIGGGFDYRDFEILECEETAKKYREKFNLEEKK